MTKLKESNYNGPITLESVYSNDYYSNISLDEFYKVGYERGMKLAEIIE